jgi:Curli production assembly/transport component CsgG
LKAVFLIVLILLGGCATAPTTVQTRNVLIVGFIDGSLRPDEVTPVLTEIEKEIGQQQSSSLFLRIRQKIIQEVIWPNDLAQLEAAKEKCDDIILVGISLHAKVYRQDGIGILGQVGVETKGSIRVSYINTQTGIARIMANGEAEESSIYGGEVGVSRTKPGVLSAIRKAAHNIESPIFHQQPLFVLAAAPARSPSNKKIQVAVAPAKEDNVPKLISSALSGIIMSALSSTSSFVAVNRGEKLNLAMSEIAITRSLAFDSGQVAKVGQMTGAKLMLVPEVFCEQARCVLNFSLFDLSSGENIRTISKDAEPQLMSFKRSIEEIVKELQNEYQNSQGEQS